MYVRTPIKFKKSRRFAPPQTNTADKLVQMRPILDDIKFKVERALKSSVDYDGMTRILKEIRDML